MDLSTSKIPERAKPLENATLSNNIDCPNLKAVQIPSGADSDTTDCASLK